MIKTLLLMSVIVAFPSCATKKPGRLPDGIEIGHEKHYAFPNHVHFIFQSAVPWKDEIVVTGLLANRSDRAKFYDPETFAIIVDGEAVEPKRSKASGLVDHHELKKVQFFYDRKDCAFLERDLPRNRVQFAAMWTTYRPTGVMVKEQYSAKQIIGK